MRRSRCRGGRSWEGAGSGRSGAGSRAPHWGGSRCIGVDEISYRRGQRYLTCVGDHATGAIVGARPGRNAATLTAFFDALGERKHSIRAVSIDMSAGYEHAIAAALPDAEICFDPFHVVRLANEAINQVRRADWNTHDKSTTATRRWLKGALDAPEGPRTPHRTPAGQARRSPDRQPHPRPRLPAQRRAPRPLPPTRPHHRARAPRRPAGLG